MRAQNFNFPPNSPKMRDLQPQNLVFLDENFPTKTKFSDRLKFKERGGATAPACPLPRPHVAMHVTCSTIARQR